jgi:hypothetical protein
MITREQAEKIRAAVGAAITGTTNDAADALTASVIGALGGVEPRVIEGWTMCQSGDSITSPDGLVTLTRDRGAIHYLAPNCSTHVPRAVLDAIDPKPAPRVDLAVLDALVSRAIERNMYSNDTHGRRRDATTADVMAVVRKVIGQ